MKKLMLLAAMLALVVVAASPAFAQSGSEIEVEEGDVTLTDTSTVEDSILQNCPASVTFGDGNVNIQGVTNSQNIGNAADAQYGNPTGIVITGNENEVEIEQALEQVGFSPEVATECAQEIAQAAAAGAGKAEAKAGAAEAKAGGAAAKAAPAAEAKAGGAEAKAGGSSSGGGGGGGGGGAEAKAGGSSGGGGAKAEAPKTLPATGGAAGLIALGAGALLVTGGLVARRITK